MTRLVRPSSTTSAANLMALSAVQMNAMVQEFRWPPYRTEQILRWLYQQRVRDIHQMTDLSKPEREHLMAIASIRRIEDCQILSSEDGTQKFLMKLDDGLLIETVLIPDEGRLTLCLSTQIGCTLDCGFCLTATLGLKRNLHAHEIVEQVLTVQDHLGSWQVITNIVLMGMGEPLANLGAVSEAIARITSKNWGLGFSPRRITLSTAGLAPRIKDVAGLGVNLAVSLNATTDDQRDRLMPAINHLYPLKALMTACRNYPLPPHRRLTFEYVMLAGVNDSEEDAKRLTKLVRGIRCKINLIPFNEFPGSDFRRPSDSAINIFQTVVRSAGLDVFVRKSKGRDVLGACGQLGRPTDSPPFALTPIQARC